jgi:MFS family permease
MGSFAAATFTIRLAMPIIAHHIKPWSLMMVSSLVAAASYFLIPLASNALILMALLFLLGLGLGAPQPIVLSLLHESAPPGRGGEAVGVRILLINLSQTVMPLVFGALGAALGIMPVFWLTAFCLTTGGWLAHKRAFAEIKPVR